MARAVSSLYSQTTTSNDITSLFSRFTVFGSEPRYRETVRQDAAVQAAQRWPLLAEIEDSAQRAVRRVQG